VPIGVLYLSWQLAGPLATILYAFLFIMAFGIVPATIMIMGSATPAGSLLGNGHFILGQLAAGHGYLVQTANGYHLAVGDADRFYLHGDWHDIDDGLRNRTVLGWRPFGIVYLKSDDDLQDARVDTAPVADGGSHEVERAGIPEAPPPSTQSFLCPDCGARYAENVTTCDCGTVVIEDGTGPDGWIVDLKRLYRTGLSRVGNIDLIETSEEQTMRDEVGSGAVSEWANVIGLVLGLIIGCVAGYVGLFM
jgi:hypothetical protein